MGACLETSHWGASTQFSAQTDVSYLSERGVSKLSMYRTMKLHFQCTLVWQMHGTGCMEFCGWGLCLRFTYFCLFCRWSMVSFEWAFWRSRIIDLISRLLEVVDQLMKCLCMILRLLYDMLLVQQELLGSFFTGSIIQHNSLKTSHKMFSKPK